MIDENKLIIWLTEWWYSSFGLEENNDSRAIKTVLCEVEKYIKRCEKLRTDGDAISRQAAIDLLLDKGMITAAIYVERIPSAQPEVRTEMSSADCISRQAAIDAIDTWDKFGVDGRCRIVKWYEGLEPYVHLRDVVLAIVNLPSARPEIVRCRDCLMHGVYRFEHGLGLNGYCSQGEREKV